jgi:hypothetical protein
MRKVLIITIVFSLVVLCAAIPGVATAEQNMKVLQIQWQRLVDKEGQTCDRCGTTETSVEDAFQMLRRSLKELDIEVVLEKKALSSSTFSKNPLESNRIWIVGKPIEEWLSATIGKSQCCSTCGDSECRTIIVDGKTYEAIPAELIVRAGLLAATQLVATPSVKPCCPPPEEVEKAKPPCCPPPEKKQ